MLNEVDRAQHSTATREALAAGRILETNAFLGEVHMQFVWLVISRRLWRSLCSVQRKYY